MPKKILLADDSITIQKVVELTFSDGDYEVVAVSNGARALEKMNEWWPDIVLADVIMPEKNGYELCQAVKSNPRTAMIPVILLTGTFEPFDPDRAEQVKCDAVVTKPFESAGLIAKVEQLLGAATPPPVVTKPDVSTGVFSAPAPDPGEVDSGATAFIPQMSASAPPPEDDIFSSRDIEADIAAFDQVAPPAPTAPVADPFDAFSAPEPSAFEAPPAAEVADSFGTMFVPSASLASELADAGSPEMEEPASSDTAALAASAEEPAAPVDPFAAFAPAPEPPSESSIFEAAPEESEAPVDAGGTVFIPPVAAAAPASASAWSTPPELEKTLPLPTGDYATPTAPTEVTLDAASSMDDMPGMAEAPAESMPEPTMMEEPASPTPEPDAYAVPDTGALPPIESEPMATVARVTAEAMPAEPMVETPVPAAPAIAEDMPMAPVGTLSDADIERIASRVVAKLSVEILREIAWEVIPDMAEIVIRKRIAELESQPS